jgi:hypothetical protein
MIIDLCNDNLKSIDNYDELARYYEFIQPFTMKLPYYLINRRSLALVQFTGSHDPLDKLQRIKISLANIIMIDTSVLLLSKD